MIHDQDATRFDLECHIFDKKDCVDIKIIYNTDLFNVNTINQLLEQYETVLEAVITTPSLPINTQQILPKKQENLMYYVFFFHAPIKQSLSSHYFDVDKQANFKMNTFKELYFLRGGLSNYKYLRVNQKLIIV